MQDSEDEDTNEESSLTEELRDDVTKATISEAIGTAFFPITREITRGSEAAIKVVKNAVRRQRKQRLGELNRDKIEAIAASAEANHSRLEDIEKLYDLLSHAAEQEIENDEVASLWSSLIEQILNGGNDTDLLVEKLSSLSTEEADLLLRIYFGKAARINIHPFFDLVAGNSRSIELQKDKDLAASLKDKGLATQPFPVLQTLFAILFPIAMLLVAAEVLRETLDGVVNVSSANNVVLMGVAGAMIGLLNLTIVRPKLRLTWIGQRICEHVRAQTDVTER